MQNVAPCSFLSPAPHMSSTFPPESANARPLPDDFSLGLNPLVNCASHLLAEIVRLRACGAEDADERKTRARRRLLEDGLREFERAALGCGLDGAVVRAAGCLLCAALDESIDASPSGAHEDRPGPSFLSFFHGEASGDGTFFSIVEHSLRQPCRRLHLLELAYLLLIIGFEGRCRQRPGGNAELRLLREEIYRRVREVRADRSLDEREAT
ncbi:Type VI secretion system protein DotU [anaerobic digester metagenome]